MKKKMLHEYTLKQLLIEEVNPESSQSWLDKDSPWVPNFIEKPFKNWIKKKTKTVSSRASKMEQENDELVKVLREKQPCWDFLLGEYDVSTSYTDHWPHEDCPWFKEHLSNDETRIKFVNLLSHVLMMDAENQSEIDQRINHTLQSINDMTGGLAGNVGDTDALLQLMTDVGKVVNFTSDRITDAAGVSAEIAVTVKLATAFIPKDIDRVQEQMQVLFAGENGGVPTALAKNSDGAFIQLDAEAKRLWFYTYERYVLDELIKNGAALPMLPRQHFESWVLTDLLGRKE